MRIPTGPRDIQVWQSRANHTTSYSGLQTCGSVWTCPVCAAKIAERRRVELLHAIDTHKAAGGALSLLTLTTPHQRGDDLAALLAQQGKALQGFLRDRKVKEVFSEMGYLGQVRALEITHGRLTDWNNGWHPHFHILQFHSVQGTEDERKDWTARLYLRWVIYCQKAGLGTPSYAHGIKLDDGTRAAQYVTKGMWGLEDEMTKGHTKKAKGGGETPFDLLRAFLADKQDGQAAALFREFGECFKGKRQLSWSNGLKARFAVAEKTDEEISIELQENAYLLGEITLEQWRDILKVDGRATVLEIAAASGWPAVARYLSVIDGAADGVIIEPAALAEARTILLDPLFTG
jgi:hypothetical protein